MNYHFIIDKINPYLKNPYIKWIIITNLIIYIPIILIINQFILDDYYLFYLISQKPSVPISLNPDEAFFLFMRPVSYAFFWIDYHIFYTNALLMKSISLFLHIILALLFFQLLKRIFILFEKQINDFILFLVTMLFCIHLDSSIWVYWISNKTELLALLFYLLSIHSFLSYIKSNNNCYIQLSTIFYVLSILSKQTGLHLPFLIFYILFLKKNIGTQLNKKVLLKYFIINIIIMIVISITNYLVFQSDLNLLSIIWKKPFSILGNVLHVLIPFYSQDLYNYFLVNKVWAFILLGLFISALLFILSIFSNKKNVKNILYALVLFFIVMYPRFLAVAETRINGILVVWFFIMVAFILNRIQFRFSIIILIMFLLYNSSTLFIRIQEINYKIKTYDKMVSEYIEIINQSNKTDFVIVAENNFTLNNQAYYRKYGKFGELKGVVNSPIFYNAALVYFNKSAFNEPFIKIFKEEREIRIESINDLIFLSIDKRRLKEYYKFEFLIPQLKSREYKQINLSINEPFPIDQFNYLFFNGLYWEILE